MALALKGFLQKRLGSKQIWSRILFTLGILVIFRLLSAIPLPGVDARAYFELLQDNPFNTLFSLLSGARFDHPSLVAIGIAPYINASIVIQLLTSVIPSLEELSKQGELGRQKINQLTRWITLPLAIVLGIMVYVVLNDPSVSSSAALSGVLKPLQAFDIATFIITATAGSILLMWLSELITENGIGNGASVIIAFGIIASIPSLLANEVSTLSGDWGNLIAGDLRSFGSSGLVTLYVIVAVLIVMVMATVIINEAMRRIPIRYARRYRADNAIESYLPLRLNQAGVMPVIFASALLSFPQIIASFILRLRDSGRLFDFAQNLYTSRIFQYTTWEHIVAFFILTIVFTYFYTFVVVKPDELAKNLQKSGAFIPGIRPGTDTVKYVINVTMKLSLFGGIFLGLIAVTPNLLTVVSDTTNRFSTLAGIAGTSILIVVSVFMDSRRKLQSLKSVEGYEIFR